MARNHLSLFRVALLLIGTSTMPAISGAGDCTGEAATGGHGTNGQHVGCAVCGTECDPCDLVECTMKVPTRVVETRMKTIVTENVEEREEVYTVFEKKPVEKVYKKKTCYLEPDVKVQTVTDEKCHLIEVPVETTYAVKTYEPGMRDVRVQREVCVNCKNADCRPCPGCGILGCLLGTNHQCKTSVEEVVPCEVMVEGEGRRKSQHSELRVAKETTKRDMAYCIKVPKEHEEFCAKAVSYELVPVERTRKVQVCVPKVERVPVEVVVCKSIPRCVYCCPSCAAEHQESCRHNGSCVK